MTEKFDYKEAISCVSKVMAKKEENRRKIYTFEEYLDIVRSDPSVLRNIHGLFRETVLDNVEKIPEKNLDDSDSIDYTGWDCSKLLAEGHTQPFFASVLFSHKFVDEMTSLGKSGKQGVIYKISGPPGCGKSTFFKNLLNKFTREAHKKDRFESVWVFEEDIIEEIRSKVYVPPANGCGLSGKDKNGEEKPVVGKIEIPCPSHCNPFQSLPVSPDNYRAMFLKKVIVDSEKDKIFNSNEFEWLWMRSCHICKAIFWALYDKFDGDLGKVLSCLRAKLYNVDRQIGRGISVFRSSDEPSKAKVLGNEKLQERINDLFGDSSLVQYKYSPWAPVDDGIVVLEDVKAKGYNVKRLEELHNKVSEGVHRVGEDFEEDLDCLYFVLINPEDEKEISSMSMSDRIVEIYIPYDTDVPTEVNIYRSIFGKDFDKDFMPELAKYFVKIILVSRMPEASDVVKLYDWISKAELDTHYKDYCDRDGKLLMIALAKAKVPLWIKEEHRKKFKRKLRRKVIDELGGLAGRKGYTGRDSNRLMGDFLKKMAQQIKKAQSKGEEYIPDLGEVLRHFKTQSRDERDKMIPKDFLDQLEHTYWSKQLHRVKSALYYFSHEDTSRDVQNYIYGVTQQLQLGSKITCPWTKETFKLTSDFFKSMEMKMHDLSSKPTHQKREGFRESIEKEYSEKTLTDEMRLQGMAITETELYLRLYRNYENNLEERVLDLWVGHGSFRRAVIDYGEPDFESGYDKKVKDAVSLLLTNLQKKKYGKHTLAQAKKTVLWVLDKEEVKKEK